MQQNQDWGVLKESFTIFLNAVEFRNGETAACDKLATELENSLYIMKKGSWDEEEDCRGRTFNLREFILFYQWKLKTEIKG